jgi:hypothetical protein
MGEQSDSAESSSSSARRILADAEALRDYLAAAGLLETTALDDAISATRMAKSAAEESSAFAALRKEVSEAVNTAKPYISLVELRAGKSPFAHGHMAKMRQVLQPMLVSVLALLAIFGTVLGFAVVQDVDQDITELHGILVQEPLKKLTELRRLVSEGALKDPKSGYYSQYEKSASDLTLLFESANEITTRTMFAVPKGDEYAGLLGKISNVLRTEIVGAQLPSRRPQKASGAVSDLSGDMTAASSDVNVGNGGAPNINVHQTGAGIPGAKITLTHVSGDPADRKESTNAVLLLPLNSCKPYDTAPIKTLYGSKNAQFLAAALDRFDNYCLAQTLDINTQQYTTVAVNNTIRALQDEMFVIGVLFLPMVGGLLGAAVFIIQFLMNNRLYPTIGTFGILFRILSGGAFGVIIGWFASSATSSTGSVQHITGTPFTLAVVAGFSIDTLSRVLLRYTAKTEEKS